MFSGGIPINIHLSLSRNSLYILGALVGAIMVGVLSTIYPLVAIGLTLVPIGLFFAIRRFKGSVLLFMALFLFIPKSGTTVGAFPISLFLVLFPFLLFAYALRVATRQYPFDRRSVQQAAFTLAFLLVGLLSFENHTGFKEFAIWFVPVFIPMFIPLFLYAAVREQSDLEKYTRRIVLMVIVLSVYGMIQYIFGAENTAIPGITVNYHEFNAVANVFAQKDNVTAVGMKVVGTYQNGNLFGNLFALTIPLIMVATFTSKKYKTVKLLFFAVSCVVGVLTLSRASLLGMMVAMLTVVWMSRNWKFRIFSITLGAIGVIAIANNSIAHRIFTFGNASGRTAQLHTFLTSLASLPSASWWRAILIGQGFTTNWTTFVPVDSSFVLLFQQSGIVGLLIYFTIPITVLLGSWRRIRESVKNGDYLGIALASGLIGSMTNMLGDHLVYLPPSAENFWLFVSLLVIWRSFKKSDGVLPTERLP